jgi:CheY-like chemotaxis protein
MATRVLYVEDEADLARTVAWQLEREGYTVVHAATGRQGLELALQDPPFDVLLLDLMLPDVSGTEICRQVRAHPRTKDMLVLMLTARGEEIDRVVGFEVGTWSSRFPCGNWRFGSRRCCGGPRRARRVRASWPRGRCAWTWRGTAAGSTAKRWP